MFRFSCVSAADFWLLRPDVRDVLCLDSLSDSCAVCSSSASRTSKHRSTTLGEKRLRAEQVPTPRRTPNNVARGEYSSVSRMPSCESGAGGAVSVAVDAATLAVQHTSAAAHSGTCLVCKQRINGVDDALVRAQLFDGEGNCLAQSPGTARGGGAGHQQREAHKRGRERVVLRVGRQEWQRTHPSLDAVQKLAPWVVNSQADASNCDHSFPAARIEVPAATAKAVCWTWARARGQRHKLVYSGHVQRARCSGSANGASGRAEGK